VIVVGANVISELMRAEPNSRVVAWIARQPRAQLTQPTSTRSRFCTALQFSRMAAADGMFSEEFAGRILPFGAAAASRYAEIMLSRRRAGKPIEGFDGLIAAIALASGAIVATRDVGGFSECCLTIVDPWTAP